jgi:hypothetical protein
MRITLILAELDGVLVDVITPIEPDCGYGDQFVSGSRDGRQ